MVPPVFDLEGYEPVASGSQRWVFRHPSDTARLIKVLRDTPETLGRSKLAIWAERHLPSQKTMRVRKEYREYLRLIVGAPSTKFHPPISHMYGFVHTSRGLGCLTDAVVQGDTLGQTLLAKLKAGTCDDADLALLNDTIRRLYVYDIRAGDMTASNFVFGRRDFGGGLGPRECVLVDGFGDIHAIPVRSMARWSNRMGLDDSCRRLARNARLHWDKKHRRFSLLPA